MMEISFYLLLLFFFIALLFLSVDAYYWWMERYPRYKIGRWQKEEEWMGKVFTKGASWLPKVPAVTVTQNRHLLLLDMMEGEFTRSWVQAWQTGGLLIGVSEFSLKDSAVSRQKTISHFINDNGKWKVKPENVDFAILAFGLLKYNDKADFLKPAMEEVIQVIEKQTGEDGLIAYSSRKNIRYIDTLGLVCPFLVLYDKIYGTAKYSALAVKQLEQFIENGMFKDTLLPVHSYELASRLPVGVYGWGRGTGWFILGLLDTYLELHVGSEKEKLQQHVLNAADYYLQFQREDGGFGIFLQNRETYDSSATAVFAYFYGRCFEMTQDQKYSEALEKCLTKLKAYTRRDGALDYCQGDTVDVGVFSQRMDIMPFAQGMLLRALKMSSTLKSN
ncbi:hypothetical protein CBW16_03635 [Flavobacteriaceae bacterium JJC]|nr:hypothetical protein CBW16_03635 [Flavobacteriaceae bacterium JJC]